MENARFAAMLTLAAALLGCGTKEDNTGAISAAVNPPPFIPTSWTTPAWFVDPANASGIASDSNTCTSAAAVTGVSKSGPCLTYGAIASRWATPTPDGGAPAPLYSPRLRQTTALTFLSSQSSNSDPVYLRPFIENGALVSIQGVLGAKQQIATGTLSNVVAKNRAAGQLLQATLPAGAAPGQLVVNATHASRAWVYKNAGGSNWLVSQPLVPETVPLTTTRPAEVDTWANGDAVTLYQPVAVDIVDASPVVTDRSGTASGDGGLALNNFILYQLTVLDPSAPGSDALNIDDTTAVYLLETSVQRLVSFGSNPSFQMPSFVNADVAGGIVASQLGGLLVSGGQFRSGSALLPTPFPIELQSADLEGDVILSGGARVQAALYGTVFVDSGSAVRAEQGGALLAGRYGPPAVWGPGLLDVSGNARLEYPNSGATAARTSLLQAGGLTLDGQNTACSIDSSGTGGWRCGIPLTPANLDAPVASGGFGGTAAVAGGASIAVTGALMCPSGQLQCGTSCVLPATDPNNCGSCGHSCPGSTCNSGVCLPFLQGEPQAVGVPGVTAFTTVGDAVAIDRNTALVGAYALNPSPGGIPTGAVLVFVRNGLSWSLQQELLPTDPTANGFGAAVAVSGDTALVGAYATLSNSGPGAAYVYTCTGSTWKLQQKLIPSDSTSVADFFGRAVALSGNTALIGAMAKNNDAGAAYVFTLSGGVWSQTQKIVGSDTVANDRFGLSVALSGNTAVVGAFGKNNWAGGAYAFTNTTGTWSQQQVLSASDGAVANDLFGYSVAASNGVILVGKPQWPSTVGVPPNNTGAVYPFTSGAGTWVAEPKIVASNGAVNDAFGTSIALLDITNSARALTTTVVAGGDPGNGWTADPPHVVLACNFHLASGATPVLQGVSFLGYNMGSGPCPSNPQTTTNPTVTLVQPTGSGAVQNWNMTPSVGSGSANDQSLDQILAAGGTPIGPAGFTFGFANLVPNAPYQVDLFGYTESAPYPQGPSGTDHTADISLNGAPSQIIGETPRKAYLFNAIAPANATGVLTVTIAQHDHVASDSPFLNGFALTSLSAAPHAATALIGASGHAGARGAAYLLQSSTGGLTWSQQPPLAAPDGIANDQFGIAVALGATASPGQFELFVGANGKFSPAASYVFLAP